MNDRNSSHVAPLTRTIVNILTGPPANAIDDKATVDSFLSMDGLKVVVGGSTAKIVARITGKELQIVTDPLAQFSPVKCSIDGIDLVTEGTVTLNILYNALIEGRQTLEEESGVIELYDLLKSADEINFVIGQAENPASSDPTFQQHGILKRQLIISLIAKRLREFGKVVTMEYI